MLQVNDTLIYKDGEYEITNSDIFKPKDFGFRLRPIDSQCFRGYKCKYTIYNETLLVKHLSIAKMAERLNAELIKNIYAERFDDTKVNYKSSNFEVQYKDIYLETNYTGQIKVARRSSGDQVIEEVLEFENGTLKDTNVTVKSLSSYRGNIDI